MSRRFAIVLALLAAACGSPAAHVATAPAERLADVARDAFDAELRVRGYRVEARGALGDKDAVVASREGAHAFYVTLGVESARADEGPKWVLRLSVFGEPQRELRGEIAPSAIAAGAALDAGGRRDLVRALGKRAADQFAQNFGL